MSKYPCDICKHHWTNITWCYTDISCKTILQCEVIWKTHHWAYRVSRRSLPVFFLYAKRLSLLSNQWNLVQFIPDMLSLSFACFHWPTLLTNPAWHQKLQVIRFQLWKNLEFATCMRQNSVKFTQKLSTMPWNESIAKQEVSFPQEASTKDLQNPTACLSCKTISRTIHSIECFVWIRIDSQMVNSQIGWNSSKKVSKIAKDLKMAPKSLKKILKEDLR